MVDDLELKAVRAFVTVVDAGDFTTAARMLRLTRSAVGKALVRLETRLGVRLLHRTTRQVSTTSDGAVFYEHCVRLLADLAEAEQAVGQRRERPTGLLKLSLPDAYGRRRILPILQEYMLRWPMVGVEATFSDRIDDMVEGGLDLAIRIGGGKANVGLVTRVVDRIRGILCASPAYIDEHGMPDGIDVLDGHDLLLFGHRGQTMCWPLHSAAAEPRSSRQRARLILDSAEALRAAALSGLGVAYLPDFLIASDLEEGSLIAIGGSSEVIDIQALYPDRRLLPVRVRLFIDMVVEQLRVSARF